jgi:hypothetical protein
LPRSDPHPFLYEFDLGGDVVGATGAMNHIGEFGIVGGFHRFLATSHEKTREVGEKVLRKEQV